MCFVVQINALRGEDLNEDFFKALFHVQEIHANCKTLLRTHHQVILQSLFCLSFETGNKPTLFIESN